jgi:hypothetical protein
MAIWPLIFIKDKDLKHDYILINHERIHLQQQIELLWFPFFLWYIGEFLIKLIFYRKWHKAYKAISFEREAYHNEKNINYLNTRRFWSFLKYIYGDGIDVSIIP